MRVESLEIPDVKLIVPTKYADSRGFFSETYNSQLLADAGITCQFVQDNHSLSAHQSVLRGLHYQIDTAAQHKLIRCIRGAILDVAVDIRKSSPTFGRHVSRILSAENFEQLYAPIGFAHGFLTLTPNTEVCYKVTSFFSPAHDRGILWNDPALKINWGITPAQATLSEKDKLHPTLAQAAFLFP